MMKTAFVYSDRFGAFRYGPDHPMRPARLRLTFELMTELGLANLPSSVMIEARQAVESELLLFHTPEYLRVLKEANTGVIPVKGPEHGIGCGDNPAFRGVYEWSCYSTGASIQAVELVASGAADIAFNIAGGLHHAMPGRASGFCYLNDAAVAVRRLVNMGKRVAYVDVDAHHGDGVEYAFYDTDKVLTISLHESGQWLFPGTGFVTDIGVKEGKGFSVNLPFPPGAGDGLFVHGFEEIVLPFIAAFRPDVLVTQLGVDTFSTDPITHLNLTTNGFERMIRAFKGLGLPWVALGGGGYDLGNVARAWALAWAEMNGVSPPEVIPEEFILKNGSIFKSAKLRDEPLKPFHLKETDVKIVEKDVAFLLREALPMVKG